MLKTEQITIAITTWTEILGFSRIPCKAIEIGNELYYVHTQILK
jgi:hypothetical protein